MIFQQYQLGAWFICSEQNIIYQGDNKKHLDHKSMQVLLYLVDHAGTQVTKAQIFNAVWGEKSTSNDILAVAISNIRKALGDSAQQPDYIKTIPSVGYCLIGNVRAIKPESQTVAKKRIVASVFITLCILFIGALLYFNQANNLSEISKNNTAQIIAVLPFYDFGSTKNNRYIIDGLADAIIDNLSQFKQLKVVSRYSSFAYRDSESTPKFIGSALGVNLLLTGSIQRVEQKLRVISQLINVKTGAQIWSKTFDGETRELFKLQDEIANAVKTFLGLKLKHSSLQDKQVNAKAYELNMLGHYYWQQRTPETLRQAIDYFEQAISLEPFYAKAHLGLANSYFFMHGYASWTFEEARKKAWPSLRKALEIEPNLAGAYATIGLFLSKEGINNFNQADPELLVRAEQAFKKAIKLSPNDANTYHWYGVLYFEQGKFDDAISMLNKALLLNPLSPTVHKMLAQVHLYSNRYNTAQKLYHRSTILKPDNGPLHLYDIKFHRIQISDIKQLFDKSPSGSAVYEKCERVSPCFIRTVISLGLNDSETAQFWRNKMESSRGDYNVLDSWMRILDAAANNDITSIIAHLEEILVNRGYRPFDRSLLIVALLQANNLDVAKRHVLLLNPTIEKQMVNADNYLELINYAHLLKLQNKPIQAATKLEEIATFLAKSKLFDQQSQLMVQSEVHAMLGNNKQAIDFFAKALAQGWLPDFSREWWSLKDNIHFLSLKGNAKFELLLDQHQQNLNQIITTHVN